MHIFYHTVRSAQWANQRKVVNNIIAHHYIATISIHLIPTCIDETKRTMKMRVTEHNQTVRKGDKRNGIALHAHTTNHSIDWEGAHVHRTAHGFWKRRTLEALPDSQGTSHHEPWLWTPPLPRMVPHPWQQHQTTTSVHLIPMHVNNYSFYHQWILVHFSTFSSSAVLTSLLTHKTTHLSVTLQYNSWRRPPWPKRSVCNWYIQRDLLKSLSISPKISIRASKYIEMHFITTHQ